MTSKDEFGLENYHMEGQTWKIESALKQFPAEAGSLIPLLQIMQENAGYISTDSVQQIAEYLKLTESQVYGVASFYAQFRFNAVFGV